MIKPKYKFLNYALRCARGNSINDKHSMEDWLRYAQEHSEMPLSQEVIDKIYAEYQKHEPQRSRKALGTALRYARGRSSTGLHPGYDKGQIDFWLGQAEESSYRLRDKAVCYIGSLGIRAIFALRKKFNQSNQKSAYTFE
jgi:hypothetical protein